MSEMIEIGTETFDILLPKNITKDIITEHLGILSRALSYEVGLYEKMAQSISEVEGKFRARKTRFEGLEQVFVAKAKQKSEGRGPTIDSLRGQAKEEYKDDFKELFTLEEHAVSQKILMEAQSRRIKIREMQIMIRQALLKSIDADIRNNGYQS